MGVGQVDQRGVGHPHHIGLMLVGVGYRQGDYPGRVCIRLPRQHAHPSDNSPVDSAVHDLEIAGDFQVKDRRLIKWDKCIVGTHRRVRIIKKSYRLHVGQGAIAVFRDLHLSGRRGIVHTATVIDTPIGHRFGFTGAQVIKQHIPVFIPQHRYPIGKEQLVEVSPPGGDWEPVIDLQGSHIRVAPERHYSADNFGHHSLKGLTLIDPAHVLSLVQQADG